MCKVRQGAKRIFVAEQSSSIGNEILEMPQGKAVPTIEHGLHLALWGKENARERKENKATT
jgi:hypothetical protein